MNFRTTSIIFGILIAMLFLFGIMVERNQPPDEGYLFPTLREDKKVQINSVVLEQDGKTYSFNKEKDGSWSLKPPESKEVWRIEADKISKIISQIKESRRNEQADVSQDPGQAGLSQPKAKVTLKGVTISEENQEETPAGEWWLELGGKSADEANWFVRSSERRKIFAVETSAVKDLNIKDINEMRSRTLLEVTPQNAEALTITQLEKGATKNELALTYNEKSSLWRFKKPAIFEVADFEGSAKETDKDQPGLKKVLDELGNIKVEKLSDFESLGSKSFADFGLADGKEILRIEVKRMEPGKKGGVLETLLVGEKKGGEKGKEYYFARLQKDQYVVKVDAKKLDLIFKVVSDPKILRSRDLSYFTLEEPDAVNIVWPEKSKEVVKLRKVDDDVWKMFLGGDQSYKANQTAIGGEKSLLDALKGKGKIQKFFDEKDADKLKALDKKLGLDDPTAEYSVYVNALEAEKKGSKDKDKDKKDKDTKELEPKLKKDVKPAAKLIFGAKDEEQNWLYVKRITFVDGKENISRVAVPIDSVIKINPSEGYLAFLDNELPSFDYADVNKLELVRSGEKFVLEKVKKAKEGEKEKGKDDKSKDEKSKDEKGKDDKGKKDETKKDDKSKEAKDKKEEGDSCQPPEMSESDACQPPEFEGGFPPPSKQQQEDIKKKIEEMMKKSKKSSSDDTWTRLEPTDLPKQGIDEENLEDVLMKLEKLKVIKWVQKIDPKKDDLSKFGLKDPRVTATLVIKKDKDDKGETRVFKFGNEGKLDKTTGVYTLVSGTDIIFLSPTGTVKALENAELRGRTITKFEVADVRELKLSGWNEKFGFKQTLSMERKDAKDPWKVKVPEDFELDQKKTDFFLGELSDLKAQKYVSFKGPLAEQRLSSKEAALVITLKLAPSEKKTDKDKKTETKDEKSKQEDKKKEETITLTIGALNKEKTAYYAQVNSLPDVVFLLPKEQFDIVEKGPNHLKEKSDSDISE